MCAILIAHRVMEGQTAIAILVSRLEYTNRQLTLVRLLTLLAIRAMVEDLAHALLAQVAES